MSSSIRIENDVSIPARDGTILRADIFFPDDGAKHPVIFMRTPYDKIKLAKSASEIVNIISMVKSGYAVVLQDVRGRFTSAGEWMQDRFAIEEKDGFDSVEWIASQKWCDGNVGMAGASFMASLQWLTAMEAPPAFKSNCTRYG